MPLGSVVFQTRSSGSLPVLPAKGGTGGVSGETHWPSRHSVAGPVQTFPHAPQLDGSLIGLRHTPPQKTVGGRQVQTPTGGVVHICGAEGGALRIVDIWESEDAWSAFRDGRLMPALEQTGLLEKGAPDVRTYPLHNVYAPMFDELGRMGSSSLAGAAA